MISSKINAYGGSFCGLIRLVSPLLDALVHALIQKNVNVFAMIKTHVLFSCNQQHSRHGPVDWSQSTHHQRLQQKVCTQAMKACDGILSGPELLP